MADASLERKCAFAPNEFVRDERRIAPVVPPVFLRRGGSSHSAIRGRPTALNGWSAHDRVLSSLSASARALVRLEALSPPTLSKVERLTRRRSSVENCASRPERQTAAD